MKFLAQALTAQDNKEVVADTIWGMCAYMIRKF